MKNRQEKKKINKHQGCDRDHKTGCLQLPISYYKYNEASYGMGWQDMERG